jgi:glycosyltransferase involved in cell wall biosynthesis
LKLLYVSSKGNIHDYRFLSKLVHDYEVLFLHYAADNIIDEIRSLKGLKIISKKTWPIKSTPYPFVLRHFKKVYDDFRPDIVHTGYVWQVGILASHYDIHPHLSMVWGSDVLIEPDTDPIKKWCVKKVMKQSDHIQCDAEYVKEKIQSDYLNSPDKITVFPWGINLETFSARDKTKSRNELSLPKDKFIVLFTRHLHPLYGLPAMLKGFKQFALEKKDVLLLLLASGKLETKVKKFIAVENLESKIRLIGRIPNHELARYLNASDVYISVSLSDGTSLSLLEAMACGLPVIVTDLPAIREWISNENGLVIPKHSSENVYEALEKYYTNRPLMQLHGSLNKKIAQERANWDLNYLKLKEIYKNLLGGIGDV